MAERDAPAYSIVVPAFERPERLAACLASLAALDFPKDRFEVLVVDDGSWTSLRPVVDGLADRLSITFIDQENQGPATARNTGAKRAKGRVLVFTDDDCQPEAGWLKSIDACLAENDGAMIGGLIVNGLGHNACAAASQQLVSFLYSYYGDENPSRFFCSNNLALPADRFWELAGFDPTFPNPAGEDRDLCERWRGAGFPMYYEVRAVVRHFHGMKLVSFWRQHFRYGCGVVGLNERRTDAGRAAIRPERVAFYTDLLRSPFRARDLRQPARVAALLALSQLASACGYAWALLDRRLRKTPQERRRRSNT